MISDILGVHIWRFYFTIRWYGGERWWSWGYIRLGPYRFSICTWKIGWLFEYYK